MEKKDHTYVMGWAKRIKALRFCGGKCSKCGDSDIFVLELHHLHDKKFNFSSRIRWSRIEPELRKCIVLCANCHFEHHAVANSRGAYVKDRLLRLKNKICASCTYDGVALDFHHTEDKKFNIGDIIGRRAKVTLEKLFKELDKSIVLCRNCHSRKHIDLERFERFKVEIGKKIDYIETKPVDREMAISLYEAGKKYVEIAAELDCAKSSISYLIKQFLESKPARVAGDVC